MRSTKAKGIEHQEMKRMAAKPELDTRCRTAGFTTTHPKGRQVSKETAMLSMLFKVKQIAPKGSPSGVKSLDGQQVTINIISEGLLMDERKGRSKWRRESLCSQETTDDENCGRRSDGVNGERMKAFWRTATTTTSWDGQDMAVRRCLLTEICQ